MRLKFRHYMRRDLFGSEWARFIWSGYDWAFHAYQEPNKDDWWEVRKRWLRKMIESCD